MSAVLEAVGVCRRFGGLVAVQAVDFSLEAGTISAIIGPNGAGKTTFFNLLAGIYRPSEGSIRFRGEPLADPQGGLSTHEIVRRGMARTFQNIRLFSGSTAVENVLVGRHTRLKCGPLASILRTPASRAEEREALIKAFDLLDYVGLNGCANLMARNLSYGHQRLLEIARALASEPVLLLLDEPAAGLNPSETEALAALIRRLREELKITVLLIEHDMKLVMGLSDRVTVLDHGQKIAEGLPEEVARHPKVIEAYLGAE